MSKLQVPYRRCDILSEDILILDWSILASKRCRSPVPEEVKQPQIIRSLRPCFTVRVFFSSPQTDNWSRGLYNSASSLHRTEPQNLFALFAYFLPYWSRLPCALCQWGCMCRGLESFRGQGAPHCADWNLSPAAGLLLSRQGLRSAASSGILRWRWQLPVSATSR